MTRHCFVRVALLSVLASQPSCLLGGRTPQLDRLADADPLAEADARERFHDLRLAQIQRALPRDYRGLVPLLDPAHGQFPYWYLNFNQIFNQYTYAYISARVMPGPVQGTVQLSGANGFTNATIDLMSNIGYALSARDRAKLHELQRVLGDQEIALVAVYEQVYGPITHKQISAANDALRSYGVEIPTKLDYVVLYVMGYLWSGDEVADAPPLSFTQIADAPDLGALFPAMPASGAVIMPAVALFLESYRGAHVIESSLQYSSWALADALANAQSPTLHNGGIKTFNPIDGVVTDYYQVAYGVGISLAEIRNGLNDSERVINLEFDFYTGATDPSRTDQLPLGQMITVMDPAGGLVPLAGRSPERTGTLRLTHEGYVYVPLTRGDWRPNTVEGWYYPDPINEAAADSHRTGYSFYVDPPYDLAARGDFGLLTGVLITNAPTVTISYDQVDQVQREDLAKRLEGGSVRLSGEALLGSSKDRLHSCEIRETPGSRGDSIVCRPGDPIDELTPASTVPQAMLMADVLLVSVSYPGEQ